MSIVPNIKEEDQDDLCLECGRDNDECACGNTLPDDFDPLDEDEWDDQWGHIQEYEDYLADRGDK